MKPSLKEIASLFLKLGVIGFGGPAAHTALMQKEVVFRKKWLSEQDFLDLVGATHLIPGPNSTELAIHIGREKGGWRGLLLAGICFILPAVFFTGLLAFAYKSYGTLPAMQSLLYGTKPAIIAVILGAIFPLASKALKSVALVVVGLSVLTLSVLGFNEIVLLFAAGVVYAAIQFCRKDTPIQNVLLPLFGMEIEAKNMQIFLIFLKIGAILYGSGYVLFAFLDAELVQTGLLSRSVLMDAIAVGQFTPGPVFSAVTFIGYQMNGIPGAVVGTIAIFLPSFVFVALLNPLVKLMRKSAPFSHFLDAVNVASISIIVFACWTMAQESIVDWRSTLIFLVSAFTVFRFPKLNTAYLVIGGSLLGFALFQM